MLKSLNAQWDTGMNSNIITTQAPLSGIATLASPGGAGTVLTMGGTTITPSYSNSYISSTPYDYNAASMRRDKVSELESITRIYNILKDSNITLATAYEDIIARYIAELFYLDNK